MPPTSPVSPHRQASAAPDPVLSAFDQLVGGGAERRQLDRGGRAVRWVEAGEGTPTIVFEAGAMSPVLTFAAVCQALVPDHRVIAYDRAGYGLSDPAPRTLAIQLDDLTALLEATGPAVVVGHSWGGLLAQVVTWQRPDLIKGLVLLDPAHEAFYLDLAPETFADLARHPRRDLPLSADPRRTDIVAYSPEIIRSLGGHYDCLLTEACASYLQTDEQLFMYLDELPMILDHVDELSVRRSRSAWPKLPLVLLTATLGRPEEWIPKVIAVQDQVAADAGGHHVIVPDAGHHIHLDRPDLVAHWIREVVSLTDRSSND
jgi:pimeloyl-ACP methyl ester carboxylesterase